MKSISVFLILIISINLESAQVVSRTIHSQSPNNGEIEIVGQWKTSGASKSAYVYGNKAYIINNNEFEILDISLPSTPNLIEKTKLSSSFLSEDIFGNGDHVYIANYKTIYVFDVNDLQVPDSVASFEVESIINDIHVVENILYIIASYDFYILDVSNPSVITQLGKLTLPEASLGLTRFHIEGDYAYIGSWSDGLYVVDIANVTQPFVYGRFIETSYIVFVQEPYAYVADSQFLYILDISDKVIPDIIDRRDNVNIPHDIFVDEKRIYTATDGGLVIYDKNDLSFITSYSTEDSGERIFFDDKLIYLSANNEGLIILQYNDPTGIGYLENNSISFNLEQNYPNPFNPSTTIGYSVPNHLNKGNEQNVKLIIYDLLGNEVKTLINRKQKHGNYNVNFSLKNMTTGVYFYRLEIDGSSRSKKMLFLK